MSARALAAAAFLAAGLGPAAAGQDSPHTLFLLYCSGCHLPDGEGMPAAGIPPFPGIVGKHLNHPDGRRYLANVPGVVNSGLPPAELAVLLNYVLDTWGDPGRPKGAKPFTAEEVAALRAKTVDDVFALRKKIAADLKRKGIDVGHFP